MTNGTNPVTTLLTQMPLFKEEAPAPPSEDGRTEQPTKQDTYGRTILVFALVLFFFVLIKNA